MSMTPDQLGFDALLQEADHDNAARAFDRETAHLPDSWAEALAYHRSQIEEHHAAMLVCDFDVALRIREDAHLLARKLNGGDPGIFAHDEAPGCVLDSQSKAADGDVPLWGQSGVFEVEAAGLSARVKMGGMFSIGANAMTYLGFSVRSVDDSKPFMSATGYRSFLGVSVPPERGLTPDGFVRRVIKSYIRDDLRGKLVQINRDSFT